MKLKKIFHKKSLKKAVALGLAAVTMAGSLAGCGKSDSKDDSTSSGSTSSAGTESGGGNSDRPALTLTVFSERANYSGMQEGWSAKILKDKFNVELNIVPNGEGVFNTRMESGNLGDIIVFGSEGDYMQARDAGLLFDWEEDNVLQDYGSYIKEHMPYALEKNRA